MLRVFFKNIKNNNMETARIIFCVHIVTEELFKFND
jgi:hypothetical protein